MEYIRIDPLIDNRPKMVRAGWWACRVFELLLKVSGKYDLRGEFSVNYANPEWLAREWNYQGNEHNGPGPMVLDGLMDLGREGLIVFADEPDVGAFHIPGWEEFYGKRDSSTDRVRKHRANRAGTPVATGETDETVETAHTPHTERTLPTALQKIWNDVAEKAGLQRCLKLAGDRERLTEARLKEQPDLGYWEQVAQRITASNFCTGKNDRGWKANYDWFVHPLTHAKVMEGKYDDRVKASNVKVVTMSDNLYGDGT